MHNQGIKDKGEHDYGKDIIHHIHAHVLLFNLFNDVHAQLLE